LAYFIGVFLLSLKKDKKEGRSRQIWERPSMLSAVSALGFLRVDPWTLAQAFFEKAGYVTVPAFDVDFAMLAVPFVGSGAEPIIVRIGAGFSVAFSVHKTCYRGKRGALARSARAFSSDRFLRPLRVPRHRRRS
jgi:hypothetical protein